MDNVMVSIFLNTKPVRERLCSLVGRTSLLTREDTGSSPDNIPSHAKYCLKVFHSQVHDCNE